jgi:hypothetical protein
MWCGGGHMHKDCPEKENISSTPSCCNCKLTDCEKQCPSNYRGCSLAKEEIRRRKSQREPKNTTGHVFPSKYATRDLSFAAALRTNKEQQKPQPSRVAVSAPNTRVQQKASPIRKRSKQHSLRSSLRHYKEMRGLQPPRRMSGQKDIMTKVSQSRFRLIACNLWTTCSK